MRKFEIYTENKNQEWIENILSIGFDGFTIIRGVGCWKGQREESLKVEIYTDNVILLEAVAEKIKRHNKQDAILISETKCEVTLL